MLSSGYRKFRFSNHYSTGSLFLTQVNDIYAVDSGTLSLVEYSGPASPLSSHTNTMII
jgi:hypothetical protein